MQLELNIQHKSYFDCSEEQDGASVQYQSSIKSFSELITLQKGDVIIQVKKKPC